MVYDASDPDICCPKPNCKVYQSARIYCRKGLRRQQFNPNSRIPGMNVNIFREYDIRGIVGEQLTDETAAAVARAIGIFLHRGGARRIAVGYDARESSPGFAKILTDELNACGLDVALLGMVPTPVVYHTTFTQNVDGGVMITGSHNPPDHNGFKISLGKSTLFGPQIREIKKIALQAETRPLGSVSQAGQTSTLDVLDDYIADIVSKVSLGPRKIKAAIDAGNGAGGITAVPVYERLGVDLVKLYTDPDPRFPNHPPDPSQIQNLADVQAAVLQHNADVGIAFDGDGDRITVVDDNGRIIWGDELMILLSRTVLAERPGSTIIAEVKCSQTLFDDIEKHGGVALMERAGHSIIKSRMKETGAVLAGEMSGHIFFADRFYGFDDAAYVGARLIEILSRTDKNLSELFEGVPEMFSTPELRVECREEVKFQVIADVSHHFAAKHKVITIDGARIIFDGGWGLVRPSNTQAILVMRFEADSAERLNAIRYEVESFVNASIERHGAGISAISSRD
jgi:phosphomannomutase/phosphoglucomutase